MTLFGGQRDISLFRNINRELINKIIDTEVDIIKAAIKDIKENLYGEALGKQYFQNVRVGCLRVDTLDTSTAETERHIVEVGEALEIDRYLPHQ